MTIHLMTIILACMRTELVYAYTNIISCKTLNADHYLYNIFKENAGAQYANHDSWYKKTNDHKMLFLS